MIRISADIIQGTGQIDSYSSDNQANTSRIDKLSIPSSGSKLFYLSENEEEITTALDGRHRWADENIGYSGWVSNTYSDENGEFAEGAEPVIEIEGTDL